MKIQWGIIGCGDVTEVKSGPAFSLVENSTLAAVMRRNVEKAKDYALRHAVPRWYGNADELISDPEVNAIYVATPPSTHAEYAIRAMESGKPVYVEKPMALNYEECEQMIAVSAKTNMPLYVAYYRRTLPGFLKVKELIEADKIGQVKSVNIELTKAPSEEERRGELGWRVDPKIAGAGHFFDLGSHQLDYLDFLFGPVRHEVSSVKNLAGLYDAEDFVAAVFTLGNDIVCNALWNFSGLTGDKDIVEIIGDKGSILFSCYDFVPVQLKNEKGKAEFNYPKPDHVQFYLIQDVVAALIGKGESPSTGHTAARTSKLMDQVVKEYYRK